MRNLTDSQTERCTDAFFIERGTAENFMWTNE